MCVFVRLRISSARIKQAASNFAWRLRGVLGGESPILGNFAARSPRSDENRGVAASIIDRRQSPPLTATVVGERAVSGGDWRLSATLALGMCR